MFSHNLKESIIAFTSLALVVLVLSGNVAGAASLQELQDKGSIRVAIADEEPYGYMDDGEARGPGPDVARHVLGELGIEDIEWIVTSFGDLIPGLQENRFDMAAAEMAVLPERCEKIIYSEPNTTYGEGLLVKQGNPYGLRSYSDFNKRNKDLKVAVLEGANQRGFLEKLGVPDEHIVTIAENEEAVEVITSGEADAYAATSLTVAGLAEKHEDVEPALDFIDPVIDGEEIRGWGAFAFNKSSEALRDAFNEVLVPYKFTDEWEETLLSYGFSQLDAVNSFKYETEQLCNK